MSNPIIENTCEHNYSEEYHYCQTDHDYDLFPTDSVNNYSDTNNTNGITPLESDPTTSQHLVLHQLTRKDTSNNSMPYDNKDTTIESSSETNEVDTIKENEMISEVTDENKSDCISGNPSHYDRAFVFDINWQNWSDHHTSGKYVKKWLNLMKPHFSRYNKHCLLQKKTGHLQKAGSRQRNKPYFRGVALCKFPSCTCQYEFIIKETPPLILSEDYKLNVRVSVTGTFDHQENEVCRMNISGKQRQKIKEDLRNTTPFICRLNTIADCSLEEVLRGDITNSPSLAQIQKISSEAQCAEDLSGNTFQHIFRCKKYFQLKYDILNTEYKPGYIQNISVTPFYVALFTELQFLYLCGLELEIISLYLDATGTIIAAPDYTTGQTMYYYVIVIPGCGHEFPPLPLGEFISGKHNIPTLTAMFSEFGTVLKHYLKTKGRKVDHLEMDWCFALIHSSLLTFNYHDLEVYLMLCYNKLMIEKATQLSDIQFTIVHICCAHVIKFVSKKIREFTKKNTELFQFCMTWFAHLQVVKTMTEADILIEHATNVFCSEKYTLQVEKSLQELQKIINTNITTENSSKKQDKEDFLLSDEDLQTQRDNSPFSQHFNKIIQQEQKKIQDSKLSAEGAENNPYFLPELILYLQKKLLAYFPLWTAIMLIFIGIDRDTSSQVENYFKILKYQLLDGKTRIKVPRFVRTMIDKILKIIKALIVSGIIKAKKNGEPLKHVTIHNLIKQHGIKINENEIEEAVATKLDLEIPVTVAPNTSIQKKLKTSHTLKVHTYSVNDPLITVDDSFNRQKLQRKHNKSGTVGYIKKPKEHESQWSRKAIPKDLEGEINSSQTKKQRMDENKFHNRDLTLMTDEGSKKSLDLQSKKKSMYETLETNIIKTPKTHQGEQSKMKKKRQFKRTPTVMYATPKIDVNSHLPCYTPEIISKEEVQSPIAMNIQNSNVENDTKFTPGLQKEACIKQPVPINKSQCKLLIEKRCTKRTAKPTKIYETYKNNQKKKYSSKIHTKNKSLPLSNANKTITGNIEPIVQYRPICNIKIDSILLVKDLQPKGRLSDDVVDAFLLISTHTASNKYTKRILLIPSLFYDTIKQGSEEFSPGWINSVDVLNYDLIMLPTHTRNPDHWSLILVDMKNKKITLLDSLFTQEFASACVIIKNICDLFEYAVTEISGSDLQWGDWTHYYPTDIYRQDNSYDCGVHVCIWGYIICNGLNVTYDDSHVEVFRSFIEKKLTSYPNFENSTYEQLKSKMSTEGNIAERSITCRSLTLRRTSPTLSANTVEYLSKLLEL